MCSYMYSARPTDRRTCVKTNLAHLRFTLSARKVSHLFPPTTISSHDNADTAQVLHVSGRSFQPLRLPPDCLKHTTVVLWRSRPRGVNRLAKCRAPFFFLKAERHTKASSLGNEGMTPPPSFQHFLCDEATKLRSGYPNTHDDEWHALVSLMKRLIACSEQCS